jgi:hypothetical protein
LLAVPCVVLSRHPDGREAFLEPGADYLPVETWQLADGSDGIFPAIDDKPVAPPSTTSGTEPEWYAITGVPHAIASIITGPNGSGQSIGNSSAAASARKGLRRPPELPLRHRCEAVAVFLN